MASENRYTERDLVLAKREGFKDGAEVVFTHFGCSLGSVAGVRWRGSGPLAVERYPLPRVTRPRVVTLGCGHEYRICDGRLEWRTHENGSWMTLHNIAHMMDELRHLLAHPTEEVDDDGA